MKVKIRFRGKEVKVKLGLIHIEGWGRDDFTPETIKKMIDVTIESEVRDCELGFLLCRCNQKIIPSPKVIKGTYMELSKEELFAQECPKGCKRVGYFHTHPHAAPRPTAIDIKIGAREMAPIICVGADKEITCYKVPNWIIEYRKMAKEYGKKAHEVYEKLRHEGYNTEEIEKHPEYESLIRTWFKYDKKFEKYITDFGEAVERDDQLHLRSYEEYGKPFLKVRWSAIQR